MNQTERDEILRLLKMTPAGPVVWGSPWDAWLFQPNAIHCAVALARKLRTVSIDVYWGTQLRTDTGRRDIEYAIQIAREAGVPLIFCHSYCHRIDPVRLMPWDLTAKTGRVGPAAAAVRCDPDDRAWIDAEARCMATAFDAALACGAGQVAPRALIDCEQATLEQPAESWAAVYARATDVIDTRLGPDTLRQWHGRSGTHRYLDRARSQFARPEAYFAPNDSRWTERRWLAQDKAWADANKAGLCPTFSLTDDYSGPLGYDAVTAVQFAARQIEALRENGCGVMGQWPIGRTVEYFRALQRFNKLWSGAPQVHAAGTAGPVTGITCGQLGGTVVSDATAEPQRPQSSGE